MFPRSKCRAATVTFQYPKNPSRVITEKEVNNIKEQLGTHRFLKKPSVHNKKILNNQHEKKAFQKL
jgi:hypothetical protein